MTTPAGKKSPQSWLRQRWLHSSSAVCGMCKCAQCPQCPRLCEIPYVAVIQDAMACAAHCGAYGC